MASSPRVRVGTLVPFVEGKSGSSNASSPMTSIPIFEGSNVVGRSNLVVVDKRVSRKHLSLRALADGSVEVVVEGPNPIVVSSEGQTRRVCAQGKAKITYDDVLELIPGEYLMKYVNMGDERKSSTSVDLSDLKKGKRHSEEDSVAAKRNRQVMEGKAKITYDDVLELIPGDYLMKYVNMGDERTTSVDLSDLKKGKRHSEEDSVAAKRNRQVMEDEALARTLQERFAEEGMSVPGVACGQVLSSLDSAGSSERNDKKTHSVGPLKDVLPLTFRLMRVQGLPSWTNTSAVTIQNVIQI